MLKLVVSTLRKRRLALFALLTFYTFHTNAQVYINEIMAANTSQFMDPTWNYSGWIELYNAGEEAVSIGNWSFSDDRNKLDKFKLPNLISNRIPAKGYFVVWCDRNDLSAQQTNFKLNCDGGELYVTDTRGNTLALSYPSQTQGTSYAREGDGEYGWAVCLTPTLSATNNTATFGSERCPTPVFNREGGLFTGTLSVRVTIPTGMQLRYTTDGSEPIATSTRSALGFFAISRTTLLRVRLFEEGKIPSSIVTQSYLLKEREYTLPIIAIVTHHNNLFDNTIGIYVAGTNGIPGNGSIGVNRNWNRSWDRPASVEFIDPTTGKRMHAQDCDISIAGGWSRGWAEKSLVLNAEKKYDGANRFDYSLFPSKPNIRLKHILLRNAGNDCTSQGGTMMKDAAIQSMIMEVMDVECQAYQPAIHYLNGAYYGIINIRERNNKQYVYSNYGYDEEEIDLFEMHPVSGYVQLCGDKEVFNHLVTLSRNAADPEVYEEIKSLLDIDGFINYTAVEFYANNWDWPQNNLKGYRNKDGGKFRFTFYDLENGFQSPSGNSFTTFRNKQYYTFDENPSGGGRVTAEIQFVTLFMNLVNNSTEFKRQFVDRFMLMTGSVFAPNRVTHIIDSLAEKIRPEMTYHQSRWGRYGFESGVTTLKSFASQRNAQVASHVRSFFAMGTAQQVDLSSNHPKGNLYVNEQPVPLSEFSGELFPPITLRAEAPAGYEFVGWRSALNKKTIFSYNSNWCYYDQGSLDNTSWNSPPSTITWKSGNSPLGFGKADIVTTVSYGNNTNNKYPTTYFYKNFTLEREPSASDGFELNLTIDDGAVVYINGAEAGRYLMNSGSVTFNTYATTYAENNPDQVTLNLPASLFKAGTNTIAIEVHQNNATSSDLYLNAELVWASEDQQEAYYATDEKITLPTTGSISLRACFTKIVDTEKLTKPVRINEISASNNIFVNEYFKQNDWIELYNTTDSVIDLAGYYLSDNINRPLKYEIPDTLGPLTVIPAKGYLIVWCDGLATSTALHAPFKLGNEEAIVMLTAPDQVWADTILYVRHGGDVSMGRYPDGGDEVYAFNRPTFNKTNQYSSYNEWLAMTVADYVYATGIENNYSYYSTAQAINYSRADQSILLTPDAEQNRIATNWPATLTISNAQGQRLFSTTLHDITQETSMAQLPRGIHIAVITYANGKRESCKFIK